MSAFTPEQQAEIDAAVAKVKADLDAEYAKRASRFRSWIIANPLAAVRWIGSACLVAGVATGWKASPLLSRLFG